MLNIIREGVENRLTLFSISLRWRKWLTIFYSGNIMGDSMVHEYLY